MDIRRVDLNLLRLLDGLLQEQNLSRASRRLGMSQPMASTSLRRLREVFQDRLFISTGRGMRPTPFAESLAAPLTLVLGTIEREILRRPFFDAASSSRVFTITTSDIGELIFVPPILQRLRAIAPGTSLRCVQSAHDQVEAALERGDIDLAIGYFPDLQQGSVFTQPLFDHPFVCIARTDHPTLDDSMSLEQFLAADHLVVTQHGRSQEIFERCIRNLGLRRRVLLQVPNFMSVPHLIANSDMIATVPLSLGAWSASNGIKLLTPPLSIPQIQLTQSWHQRMDADLSISWLRDCVARELVQRDPSLALSPGYATMFQ